VCDPEDTAAAGPSSLAGGGAAMSDIADGDASDRPRPGDDTTINEAGTPGFAVDGTDSFAVPGPADGQTPLDEAAAAAPWRRLLVTLGAAVIVLALVAIIGTAGRDGSDAGTMRGATETTVPDFTLPSPFGGEDSDETATTVADSLDQTYVGDSTVATYDPYVTDSSYPDDTLPASTDDAFDSPPLEIPTYRPYVPPVRNVPPVTRPRVTIPARRPTTPTTRPVTTTTLATATTPPTSSTTATTTTQPPAAPVSNWQRPATSLGVLCPDAVRLWAGKQSTLAAVGAARAWRSIDGGANWAAVTGVGVPTAYADDPAGGATAWVGTAAGVFELGSARRVGDLENVTSLSAGASSGTTALVAVADGAVQRSVDGGTTWTPITLPARAAPGEVLALDAQQVLVGTSAGVLRSVDGAAFESTGTAAVVGAPVRQDATISWLLASRGGIARSTDGGATWQAVNATGIAPAATSLAAGPNGVLLVPGADVKVLSSADGGVTWAPLADQPPYRPDGIVHGAAATVIWTTGCAAGTADPANAVLRLADS
jgi:hypothetical protein